MLRMSHLLRGFYSLRLGRRHCLLVISRIPIQCYELDTCKHIMCRSCLSLYCQENITNGIVNIPCCYPLGYTTSEKGENDENRGSFLHTTAPNTSWASWSMEDSVMLSDNIIGNNSSIVESRSNKPRSGNRSHTLCGTIFTDHDVEQIILLSGNATADMDALNLYSKYQRFKFDILHGDTCRRCPICDTARIFQLRNSGSSLNTSSSPHDNIEQQQQQEQQPPIEVSSPLYSISLREEQQELIQNEPITPVVNCLECGAEFCYFHSNAHLGRTCEEYEKELQEDKESAEYLHNHAKRCPNCGINIQKIDGCDRMQCIMCQTNFSWLSLVITNDGNLHLREPEQRIPLLAWWCRWHCLVHVTNLIYWVLIFYLPIPSLIRTVIFCIYWVVFFSFIFTYIHLIFTSIHG
jgi:hypothetical protein